MLLCADPFEIGVEEWGLGGIAPVVIAPTKGAKTGMRAPSR